MFTHTGGSTNLGTHVADGSHTGAGDGVNARSIVLNDGASTSLDGEDAGDLQDHVLGARPAFQLTWSQRVLSFVCKNMVS